MTGLLAPCLAQCSTFQRQLQAFIPGRQAAFRKQCLTAYRWKEADACLGELLGASTVHIACLATAGCRQPQLASGTRFAANPVNHQAIKQQSWTSLLCVVATGFPFLCLSASTRCYLLCSLQTSDVHEVKVLYLHLPAGSADCCLCSSSSVGSSR